LRVVLLVPTQRSLLGAGARALSAWLRARGHHVRILFLPADARLTRDRDGHLLAHFGLPPSVLAEVVAACAGAGLVGVSLLSCFFELACELTRALKEARPECPVVWGGIHPTVRPEECLEHADYACLGQGEQALEELCAALDGGGETTAIPNLWTRREGEIVRNPVRPAGPRMDALPTPDWELDRHLTRDARTGRLAPLTLARFRASLHHVRAGRQRALRSLVFLGSRGCPHRCAYCGNSRYHELYGPSWGSDRLTVDRLVDELAELVARFPFIEEIELGDDDFAARPLEEIVRFCARVRPDVGRPFHLLTTPARVQPAQVEPLIEAGCVFFQVGIQSAWPATLARYRRRDEREEVQRAAALLASQVGRTAPPCYHVILDDPGEDLAASVATLRFVNGLPRPFWLKRSGLVPYPGTPVHALLASEGRLDPTEDRARVYPRVLTAVRPTPVALAWRLLSDGAPPALVERLAQHLQRREGGGPAMRALAPGVERALVAVQQARRWGHLGIGALSRGDWSYLGERVLARWTDRRHRLPTSVSPG